VGNVPELSHETGYVGQEGEVENRGTNRDSSINSSRFNLKVEGKLRIPGMGKGGHSENLLVKEQTLDGGLNLK